MAGLPAASELEALPPSEQARHHDENDTSEPSTSMAPRGVRRGPWRGARPGRERWSVAAGGERGESARQRFSTNTAGWLLLLLPSHTVTPARVAGVTYENITGPRPPWAGLAQGRPGRPSLAVGPAVRAAAGACHLRGRVAARGGPVTPHYALPGAARNAREPRAALRSAA